MIAIRSRNIYDTSKEFIQEGTGINPFFLTKLISFIIKCMKSLPLWSAIKLSVFGYRSETASSASVDLSFRILKTITLKKTVYL